MINWNRYTPTGIPEPEETFEQVERKLKRMLAEELKRAEETLSRLQHIKELAVKYNQLKPQQISTEK